MIHAGCSSWTWEQHRRFMSWRQIRGYTGSVWGRKIFGVSTNFIKERSFKSSDDWRKNVFLHIRVSFQFYGQKLDDAHFQNFLNDINDDNYSLPSWWQYSNKEGSNIRPDNLKIWSNDTSIFRSLCDISRGRLWIIVSLCIIFLCCYKYQDYDQD